MLGSNARMSQIQITDNSMNTANQELTQELQTSNIEISHLQAEASDQRNSVARSQSTDLSRETVQCLLRDFLIEIGFALFPILTMQKK